LAEEEGTQSALEPSTQAEDLVARGYRSGRLVQVQRSARPLRNIRWVVILSAAGGRAKRTHQRSRRIPIPWSVFAVFS